MNNVIVKIYNENIDNLQLLTLNGAFTGNPYVQILVSQHTLHFMEEGPAKKVVYGNS